MALLLIILYLLIPVMGFAHVNNADAGAANIRSMGVVAGSPCDHCPCSDEQGPRCCDADFCCCAFHSPQVQGVQVRYAPVVTIARPAEPFWVLPRVYLSIFVPPQNPSIDRLSDLIENEYTWMPFAAV